MASSNHGCHCNKRKREREREKGAPQGSRDEKPRDRRTNQSQTREGFGVSSGGSRHWVTGCVHPHSKLLFRSSPIKIRFTNSMSRSRGGTSRRFTFVANYKLSDFFINVPFCCNIFIMLYILLSIWN